MEQQQDKSGHCIGEHEVSTMTDLSVLTLRRWRSQGKGPRFLKLGGAVRYRLSDVEAWLLAQYR
jgi:predicted DNA-binding transcriptional regulator AlpA